MTQLELEAYIQRQIKDRAYFGDIVPAMNRAARAIATSDEPLILLQDLIATDTVSAIDPAYVVTVPTYTPGTPGPYTSVTASSILARTYTSVTSLGYGLDWAVFHTVTPHGFTNGMLVRNDGSVSGYDGDLYVIGVSDGDSGYCLTTVSDSAANIVAYISTDTGTTTPLVGSRALFHSADHVFTNGQYVRNAGFVAGYSGDLYIYDANGVGGAGTFFLTEEYNDDNTVILYDTTDTGTTTPLYEDPAPERLQNKVAMPDDYCRELFKCYSTTNEDPVDIYADSQQMEAADVSYDDTGDVYGVCVEAGYLKYCKSPTVEEELEISYYANPPLFAEGSNDEVTWLPEEFQQQLIGNYAAAEILNSMATDFDYGAEKRELCSQRAQSLIGQFGMELQNLYRKTHGSRPKQFVKQSRSLQFF